MTEIDWARLLVEEDVEGLWSGLFQLVCRHPAVRPLHFATDSAAVSSQTEINADLAQELFLELFQKQRFDHYVRNGYRSVDIENELARIEVPNLVGARLRKRYPESFRMARRVSALLKTSTRFRRFGAESASEELTKDGSGTKTSRRGRPPKKAKASAEDVARQVALLEEEDDLEVAEESSVEELPSAKKNSNGAEPRRQR